MEDAHLILIAGALFALGIGAALVAARLRVPGLVVFLALGMLIGSDGLGWIDFDDAELTRTVGVIAISLILFEGGLLVGWRGIRPVMRTAVSLAIIGTIVTAVIAGFAAKWIFGLSTLEGLLVGAIVSATDAAAVFSVLRGSSIRQRVALTLEGESGLNDAVGLVFVIGLIDAIQKPSYGAIDFLGLFAMNMAIGLALGVGIGLLGVWAFRRLDFATPGLYPVASVTLVALAYGATSSLDGSGFLAVYLVGLVIGSSEIPARRTITAFHQGLAWVGQIALFFTLGLLVFPSQLGGVMGQGLLLAAALMLVARPLAALAATIADRFSLRERILLGWAGLRGAVPIVLATFPVIEEVPGSKEIFNIVFFVVASSTLIQGATFEFLARRFRLTTSQPALPRPVLEIGSIKRLGAELIEYPIDPEDGVVGLRVRELGLPREALVSVIVRGGEAIPPRGSTVIEAGDRLHIIVRREFRAEVEHLFRA